MDNRKLLFAFLLTLSTIVMGLVALNVDRRLTCIPAPTTSTVFLDVHDEGMAYYAKGEAREFFVLYKRPLDKAQTCYELAIEKYNQAIMIDPEHRMGYSARGSAYMMLHEYDKALADFEKILELAYDDERVRWRIASVYEKQGDMATALVKYEEALLFMEQSSYWNALQPDLLAERKAYVEELKQRMK